MRIVAGRHRGRRLVAPKGLDVRPTSDRAREALFNILEHGGHPLEGASFLDLFAGCGAVGLEALSRGAAQVTLVERHRPALDAIGKNIAALGAGDRVRLIAADASRLGRAPATFDLVFIDPPYGSGLLPGTLAALTAQGWLAPAACIVCETAAGERVVPPPGLTMQLERRYGAARLTFLEWPGPPA